MEEPVGGFVLTELGTAITLNPKKPDWDNPNLALVLSFEVQSLDDFKL
jgi:hypothetical protein